MQLKLMGTLLFAVVFLLMLAVVLGGMTLTGFGVGLSLAFTVLGLICISL